VSSIARVSIAALVRNQYPRVREPSSNHPAAARVQESGIGTRSDARCALGKSEEIFARLVRCSNAPARMVVYPGGSHSMATSGKPSHRVDYHARLVAWVEQWTRS
jgi:hypothetical protein